MTNEDYVNDTRCPICGSDDILIRSEVEFGGDFITQPVQCEACGRHWDQIYILTGYELSP